ncbi:putative NAC transcription factor 29-like [Cocos nucifera]|uniref:Putative NAC transcription factor 29-like n=1 Tax=Cocos nucifera TaxID=13894 RepID=A0A8K0HYM6_COCNU|nr:putative NAC transcription factor 29-like [Cocos nucifera]
MALMPGWRFKPFDDELLDSFLRKKILGLPLSYHLIVEADVYGDDPKNLTARYNMATRDNEWYFFTSTVRMHPDASDSSRASRRAGEGRWKATQRIKTVLDSDHNVLGSKQCFCYMERCPSSGETKTIWLMEEYSIHDLRRQAGSSAVSGTNKLDEWVICKIYLTPKARKAHVTGEDLHETQPVGRAAPEPAAKRRRIEEEPQMMGPLCMHPCQDIIGYHQTLQPPDDALTQLVDVCSASIDGAVPVLVETMSSFYMHHSQNIGAQHQILQLLDDDLPQLVDISDASIDGYSPTQHASDEPSIPSDSFQIHQPTNDTLLYCDPLPDNALPQLIDVSDASPTQHASKETSILSQEFADTFQIHQSADETLSHSDPVAPAVVEMMEGPEHVSGQADLDQILRYMDTEDSSITFSPEIMQAHDEKIEQMVALLESLLHDPSVPSIDDVL